MTNGKRWVYFNDEEVEGLNDEFIAKLEMARKYAEVPFIITSGLRLPTDNATVGGVQDSAHLQGCAVDLRSGDPHTHFKIIAGAIKAGFTRIGYYTDANGRCSHVHIDGSPSLAKEVMWYGVSH